MTLKRATGTLLQSEQVTIDRACEGDLRQLVLDKIPQDVEIPGDAEAELHELPGSDEPPPTLDGSRSPDYSAQNELRTLAR